MKENTDINKRDICFDIAKGGGIVLMVYAHSIIVLNNEFLFRYIYLFHMALFFIISGRFLSDRYAKSASGVLEYFLKGLRRLVVPYLFFNLLFLFLHNGLYDIHFFPQDGTFFDIVDTEVPIKNPIKYYSNFDIFKHFICIMLLGLQEFFVGTTWFLKVLFFISTGYVAVCFLLNKFIRAINTDLIKTLLCFCCLLIGYYMSLKDWQFYKIGTIFSCVILFHIGTLVKKYKIFNVNNFIIVISAILLAFINIVNTRYFNISRNYYNNPFWFISASILGYLLVIGLSNRIKNIKLFSDALSYIGRNTVPILCLHLFLFKVVILFQVLYYHKSIRMLEAYETYYTSYVWAIVYTIIGIVLPLAINLVYLFIKNRSKNILNIPYLKL